MTAGNVIDFDAFRAEREGVERTFRIGGTSYTMAPIIPAALVVKTLRLKHELGEDEDATIHVFDTLGRSVFGPDKWDELLEVHQIGFDEIPVLLEKVIASYAPPKALGKKAPTSKTPESSTTSSRPGRGSRRTSSASTGSTSSRSSES